MKITFHGAARTVTGSKHLLQLADGRQLLLDCGMFQGMGKDTIRLNREWGFDPAAIDVVIISHAHIDHVGLLPRLVRDGFRGQVFATPQTIELARLLLLDSAHIQEADVLHLNKIRIHKGQAPAEPLYTEDDVLNAMPLFVPMAYDNTFEVMKGVQCTFTDAGHILGSAAVNLLVTDKGTTRRITFSGDVGRYRDLILRSPSPFPQADYLILESTYGNRLHDLVVHSQGDLLHHITETCLKRHGKLIIPSFSVGRTQELLYLLNRLSLEHRLPLVDYFVDSPLSTEATRVMKEHPECFNRDVQHLLKQDDDVFSFPGLHFTQTVDESKALDSRQEPCVIISASGMAEAGRVKHHIAHGIGHANNTILIVGYCEPMSLGGKLRNGDKRVTIFGEHYDVEAQVATMQSMSAHGDYQDISQWLSCQDPGEVKKLFLVHGEYETQVAFRDRLMLKGFREIDIPNQHETFTLQ